MDEVVCYVCLEDGGKNVCDCNSFIHLECQKKLIKSLYDSKHDTTTIHKCTVCKKDYRNIFKEEKRVLLQETVLYISFWAVMTVILPIATVGVYMWNAQDSLFCVLVFFTGFAYVVTFFHALIYIFFRDSLYSVTYEITWKC